MRAPLRCIIQFVFCLLVFNYGNAFAVTPTEIKLRYHLDSQLNNEQLVLHVRLDMKGMTSKRSVLVLPSTWGDVNGLGNGIQHLRAESANTKITDTSDPLRKFLEVSDSTSASISYDVLKDWDGPLRENVRHLVHLEPTWIEINTGNALIHPALKPSDPVDCSFEWSIPVGWSLATSFGVRDRQQHFRGVWDRVQNAVFVAGDFRIHKQKRGRERLFLAVRGTWCVSDDEAKKKITEIFAIERAFWKDDDFPYYLVTVVPFDSSQRGVSGGGGFTDAFSIHTAPEEGFTIGLLSLFTHELFHAWNPYKIGRMPNAPEDIYWFTEGFTTYYQSLLLWRGGLLTTQQYLNAMNQSLRNYYLSPSRNITTKELIQLAQSGHGKDQISYDRGAAIALWLDWSIRRKTHSQKTLGDVMRELVLEGRTQGHSFPELTSDQVFAVTSKYISVDEQAQMKAFVNGIVNVKFPGDALQPCAVEQLVDIPRFDIGMSRDQLENKRVVTNLEAGSEAQKAGIEEGDKVIKLSVYWDDVTKPVDLTVERGGAILPFTFRPTGASLGLVPQFSLQSSTDSQSCPPPLSTPR
ncbi:hypothetical protein [Granulicella aggregans]|nr:hypothetical protein [Granulicella aggregans]